MSRIPAAPSPIPMPFPNVSTAASGPPKVNARKKRVELRGGAIPMATGDEAGVARGTRSTKNSDTAPALAPPFSIQIQAAEYHRSAVTYNPKLDPKYDARSSSAAFGQGDAVSFDPRAGKGQSLIGHELSHVAQQSDTSPTAR